MGLAIKAIAAWMLALGLSLGVAVQLQGADQAGMRRWQTDMEDGASLVPAQWDSLSRQWCDRDGAELLRLLGEPASDWLKPTCKVQAVSIENPSISLQSLLERWHEELGQRQRDIRVALARRATSHLPSTKLTSATAATSDGENDLVRLEVQISEDDVVLHGKLSQRLAQWDDWSARMATRSRLGSDRDQLVQLWDLAHSLDGFRRDVASQWVIRLRSAHAIRDRARASWFMVTYLPWLLLLHAGVTWVAWVLSRRLEVGSASAAVLALGLFSWGALSVAGIAPPWQEHLVWVWASMVWITGMTVRASLKAHARRFLIEPSPPPVWLLPGWWCFSSLGWLMLVDISMNFHGRLRFIALEQWWTWWGAIGVLSLGLLGREHLNRWLSQWVDAWHLPNSKGAWAWLGRGFGVTACVAVLVLIHRQNVGTYITGELLKLMVLVAMTGWVVWRMPIAAVAWHHQDFRGSLNQFWGSGVCLVAVIAGALLTQDRGPLLIVLIVMAILHATVMGWTVGLMVIGLGLLSLFVVGDALEVVSSRLQAWRDPFTANHDDMARLLWFRQAAAELGWGFGPGQAPWCGTTQGEVCRGLPLQLQSDYTFTALTGWWGLRGAWLIAAAFCLYAFALMRHAAIQMQVQLRASALLNPQGVVRSHASAGLLLLALLMLVQCWITVGGNLGWLPLTGVTWPLISYGRASLWSMTFLLALWSVMQEPRHA